METKEQISNLLKETQKDRRMSQEELALALGISRQSLSKWINMAAVPKFETITRMRSSDETWVRMVGIELTMIMLSG